jgi:ABC-type multidrug transport system fused ATPase/permease subunit
MHNLSALLSALSENWNVTSSARRKLSSIKKAQRALISNLGKLLLITWQEDKVLFILYFTSSILGALLLYIVYFVYKLMVDQVATQTHLVSSLPLLFIIITYLFFEYLSRFVNFTFNQYFFDFFIRAKLQNALTRKFMEKLGKLEFAQLENGEVRNLIAKVENTYNFRLPEILSRMNAIVYNLAALIFSLVIALQFSPQYFIILALVSLPVYYLRAKYGNIAWNSYSTNAANMNYLWYIRSLFTNFQTLSEMKVYGLQNHFLKKTKDMQDKVLQDYQRPMMIYSILSTCSFILIPVAIYFAMRNFLSGMTHNLYSLGDFTFFLNALFTFSGQISSILINFGSLSENSLYLNDYFSLLEVKNKITVTKNPKFFDIVGPRTIVFENVSFKYPNSEKYSLSNINLTINRGEDIAIVGQNGAGKSTLIKLLFRFYDPTEGRILVDGIDVKEIDIEHWYEHIGVLFQDFAKYALTLKENIMFGDINKTDISDIPTSLQRSQGDDVIQMLPKGYEQILGKWFDTGIDLSGGQWQKVAIARAMYRNAPILIMDEPTSAIDAEAEYQIFKNLKEIYQQKTILFISHRFSTVRMANKIYVLEKGQMVECGTHQSLMNRNGLYSKFFFLQKKGYE